MAGSMQDQIHQLEELGQLQRRFTCDVSHELRTPLTTVRMAADVLHASREQFPAGLARSTELLVDELDRFEALLGDLLEISKLDAGVEELASELVDVTGIARSAIASVQGIVGGTTTVIELLVPEPGAPDATAEVDARRVERILRNLLGNALDHGEGLPVRITVLGDEAAVAVTVRDYGVGLRHGEHDLVFNRFWRATPPATAAPAAPVSASRSALRTPGCTVAGCTRGANPARARRSGSPCPANPTPSSPAVRYLWSRRTSSSHRSSPRYPPSRSPRARAASWSRPW